MNGLNNIMMNQNDPKALIVDMGWVHEYNTQINNALLSNKISMEAVVTAIASQPSYYHDSDSMLWAELENTFTDDEMNRLDNESVALLIEVLKEEFYHKVDNAFPNLLHNYVYKQWIDGSSMCLVREDLHEQNNFGYKSPT